MLVFKFNPPDFNENSRIAFVTTKFIRISNYHTPQKKKPSQKLGFSVLTFSKFFRCQIVLLFLLTKSMF
jgi:hypothetical protein